MGNINYYNYDLLFWVHSIKYNYKPLYKLEIYKYADFNLLVNISNEINILDFGNQITL